MSWRRRAGWVGVAAVIALGSCSNAAVVRYRVTVAVRTPQGVRSGSSVWEWRLSRPTVALATAYDGKFRGEAVAVDVAPGKTLFALIRGEDGSTSYAELLPEWTFGDTARSLRGERAKFGDDTVADLRDVASRVGERVTLSCGGKPGCPMLVTFTNPADPKSVTRVDPNNLTVSFGQGYALEAITVEVTKDKVTTNIEDKLPWLKGHPGTFKPNPPRFSNDPADHDLRYLAPDGFSTEIYK